MKIPFHNLAEQYRKFAEGDLAALKCAIDEGQFILGEAVSNFEITMKEVFCLRNFISVGSGTDALFLALQRIKANTEFSEANYIITTPMSYISSTSSIYLSGMKPLFCDVDKAMNLCPKAVTQLLEDRNDIRGILLVHFGGIPAQMSEFDAIARKFKVPIIEDCAQALGTEYSGKSVGSFCDFGAFSFHPLKILGALGDAGGVSFNNSDFGGYFVAARNHGHNSRDNVAFFSHNMRMDSIQARFLQARIASLAHSIIVREEQVASYKERLRDVVDMGVLSYPSPPTKATRISYNFFMVKVQQRDGLQAYLLDKGIETKVHYKRLLCDLDANKGDEWIERSDLSNAKRYVRAILSLPIGSHITDREIDYICEEISNFFQSRRNITK